MAYLGNTPTQQAFTPQVDFFNGNGSTTAFTLSRPVASVAQIEVTVNNVPQNPSDAYTVSGNTITFTGAPSSGTNNIYVQYTSPITQVIQPGQGTVGTAQIQDGAVITQDIANGAVTTAKLASVTGTGAVALASLPTFTTTIGVGGATASASGSGISFPATQSASSDANTLDDYEEGIFTPTLTFGGGSTGVVYQTDGRQGWYVKVGRFVTVTIYIYTVSKGSSTGGVVVSGLPFASAATGANYMDYYFPFGARAGFTLSAGFLPFAYIANSGDTNITLYNNNVTAAGTPTQIQNTAMSNVLEISIQMTYRTAS
jgi:hypothetical protein